jgi:DNA-binding response OmpR family regulator
MAKSQTLQRHDLVLDRQRHRVVKSGATIGLLPKEFQLLEFLMANPNHVFSAESLLDSVWPSEATATTEALRSTIKRLRKKLDPKAVLIKTVHGVGYIFECGDSSD